MKLSVIIPAFNEESYLASCLSSIFNQTEPADEVIVVDNNSSDTTAKIASKFRTRVITERRRGMTVARNTGFDAARFPLIARTDADTIVPKNWIQLIKQGFEDKNIVALSGPAKSESKAFTSMTKLYFPINKLLLGHNVLLGPNFAIRNSTWKKIRSEICLNDERVHEDLDIAIHAAKFGLIAYDNRLIVKTSARRLENDPGSYFGEYLLRWLTTQAEHTGSSKKNSRRRQISPVS